MSIFQNFHSLNVRLSTDALQSTEEETVLSNNFRISGNGIVILASDSNPVRLQKSNGEEIALTLEDWQENSEDAFTLMFSDDVSLLFNADEAGFAIQSELPSSRDSIIIPFETASAFNITDVLKNRIIVKSRDKSFSLLAGDVTTNSIILSPQSSTIAKVATYEETQAFSYNAVIGMDNANQEVLDAAVTQARNYIVRIFESAQGDTSNEKFVAAYVSELALQGRYAEAIANVPTSFVNGNNRTYFTAPYFNTLVAMNQTLLQEKENILFSMQYSLERNILDVYMLDSFPTFLLQQRADNIEAILSLPASMEVFEPTVQQAAGIIDVYITLAKVLPTSAALLEPVLEKCIEVLQSSTTLDGEFLNIVSDDGSIDTTFAAKAGAILQRYGQLTSRLELTSGGTMLLVSALQNITSISSSTLAYMYPYLISDNPYYPHAEVLGYNDGTPIWIWNIIPEKEYFQSPDGTITFNFDFPVTEIYHSIITGIEPFDSIEIYGLDYATDFRFETYNAPGYVYQNETDTLLLRYRQRSEIEEMKLIYTPQVAPPTSEAGSTDSSSLENGE